MSSTFSISSAGVPSIDFPVVGLSDLEVDGLGLINEKGDLVEAPHITELCVKIYRPGGEKNFYKTVYMVKPPSAENAGPFMRKIPHNRIRQPAKESLEKVRKYILEKIPAGEKFYMIVYNKSWDENVLKQNFARWKVGMDWRKVVFVDMAEIAHHMGFPCGTTQSRMASNYEFDEPAPANLHTSFADARLLTLICRRVFKEAEKDVVRFRAAFESPDPERALAEYALACDPTLGPQPRVLEAIERVKLERRAVRKIQICASVDTETNSKEEKEVAHYEPAIRVLQFAGLMVHQDGTYSIEQVFSRLVNPGEGVVIAPEAAAIHKITHEKIAGKPTALRVFKEFLEEINRSQVLRECAVAYDVSHPEEPISALGVDIKYILNFVGYNINQFDIKILEQELMIRDGDLEPFDLKQMMKDGIIQSFDMLPLMQTWFTGMSAKPVDRKLTTIAEFFGIDTTNAHDAAKDVWLVLEVLKKVCEGLNIYTVINALAPFKKSPGIAAKEIIRKAKELVVLGCGQDEAVRQAVDLYKEKVLREEEEKIEKSRGKRKFENIEEATSSRGGRAPRKAMHLETSQEQLVASLDPYPIEGHFVLR